MESSAQPRPIRTIAVIGAGLMGHGIALELAVHGYEVRLFDSNPEQLVRAEQRIADSLALLESSGNLTADQVATANQHLRRTGDLADAVAGVDLVIEAVFENLAVKQAVFRELDALAPATAIFASNTSSYMPSSLATAFPAAALPTVTFEDGIDLYFGGERLELVHVSPAHTAGDVAVILRTSNVVHMGDVFLSGAYPFADVDNGGDFDGVIEFCRAVLARIDRDTVIVPGHGRVATYEELEAYIEMLESVRERIVALIEGGATLAQVVAAEPTKEWDAKYGNPRTFFLDRAFKSLGGR